MALQGKVLITGASGFIGRRLKSALLDAGNDVVAIRRAGSPAAKAGRSVEGDYADRAGLAKIMAAEQPDYVLHVAGVTKGVRYEDFQRGNVMPTENLLGAITDAGVQVHRFVHVSSLAACGPSSATWDRAESDPPAPVEHYGQSKLEAERVVQEFCGDVPCTIIRPAGVYGPGDVDYFNLFQSALQGWNVFFGNRDRRMSVIYVDDCVRGILEAARSGNTVGKAYFLADGQPITWGAFQDEIVSAIPNKARTLNLPEAIVTLGAVAGELATKFDKKPRLLNRQKAIMGAQEAWTCKVDAAREDFGFDAQTYPAEGVPLTHQWYADNDWY